MASINFSARYEVGAYGLGSDVAQVVFDSASIQGCWLSCADFSYSVFKAAAIELISGFSAAGLTE